MGQIKREYFFKGLDTRTNKLFRQDGTASDCRNVRLDANKKLIKINDMETKIIPRALTDLAGPFENNLPFSAKIIDLMPYENIFVLATVMRLEEVPGSYKDVNKFYKWDPDLNTVEFIPFEKEVFIDDNNVTSNFGQIVYKNGSDMEGGFSYVNQENVLYFIGTKYPDFTIQDFSYNSEDQKFNRSPIFTYDGKVIGRSGTPDFTVNKQTEDLGVQNTNEYVRLVPVKIDSLGRFTFGNYTTSLGSNVDIGGGEKVISTTVQFVDKAYDYLAFLAITSGGGNVNLNLVDPPASRTVSFSPFVPSSRPPGSSTPGSHFQGYHSAGKGQILYGIDYTYLSIGVGGFPPTERSITESYFFYRCTIESINYVANTAVLGEYKKYSSITGLWEDSPVFIHNRGSSNRPAVLSNILHLVYGSSNFTFGYTLKGFAPAYYNMSFHGLQYATAKAYSGALPLSGPIGITSSSELFLWANNDLNTTIDTSTVKLPPPKVIHLTEYLSTIVAVDEKSLYFSDISLGGNIETFTPFDNFQFGSSDRGPVTGVFSNETFLVGFRKEESYYITGNIFNSNYRIQSYKSTRIGCSDARSIKDFKGGGIFASEKGIYVAIQGGVIEELTDVIQTVFTNNALGLSLDQFDVKSVVDFKREYIYFSIKSNLSTQDYFILAFSYYHQSWFIYDNISGVGGFDLFNDRLHTSDGTNILIEKDTSTEAVAFHRGNFETLGIPSFSKKFLQVLLFTIDSTQDHTIGIKTYRNWNKELIETEQEKGILAGQVDMTQRFNPSRSKSLAIEISSEANNELILNGYEYEVEDDVGMFKNDDN